MWKVDGNRNCEHLRENYREADTMREGYIVFFFLLLPPKASFVSKKKVQHRRNKFSGRLNLPYFHSSRIVYIAVSFLSFGYRIISIVGSPVFSSSASYTTTGHKEIWLENSLSQKISSFLFWEACR